MNMVKRLAAWIGLALAASALWIFADNSAGLTALALVIAVPAAAILASLLAGRSFGVNISAPESCTSGDVIYCIIELERAPKLCNISAEMAIRNIHTGDESRVSIELHKGKAVLEITPQYCGVTELIVRNLILSDAFGITRRRISCGEEAKLTAMPKLCEMNIGVTRQSFAMPDSDEYSAVRPGYDSSETFGIREYIPGDNIKSIHWKLSQKTGNTMVREYSLPVINQVLLMLDLPKCASSEEINTLTEVFSSVSALLANADVAHRLAWIDYKNGDKISFDVKSNEDFSGVLDLLLGQAPNMDTASAAELIHERGGFAHVVYVGRDYSDALTDSFNGSRVNALLLDSEQSGMTNDGSYIMGFTEDNWREKLNTFEI